MAKIRFLDNVPIGVFATNPNGGGGVTTSGSFTGSFSGSFIGDLTGTSSYAIQSLSSSYALTASYFSGSIPNAISASYALTASSADNFNIRNSLTASGLIYPTIDGLYGQSIQTDGSGSLFFEDIHTIYEHIIAGENLFKSDPLYISGSSISGRPIAYKAEALDPLKMPAVLVANEDINQGDEGRGVVLGLIEGIDLSIYEDGDEIYVGADGTWTNIRPAEENIVQLLGVVTKAGVDGKALILNPGPFNLPNLPPGYIWVGDPDDYPVAVSTSSIQNVVSSSFASTASYLNTLNQDLTFNGNLTLNGTASITYLNVSYESASVIYSSGSNQFGDATDDTQTLIGRVIVSGSLEVTGSTNIPSITGSLLGTASFATQALSASFATSASYAPVTPPFPYTGSALITGSLGVTGSVNIVSANTNYSAIGTGYNIQFNRASGLGLRIGTTATDNILQAYSGVTGSSLSLNPFGGSVTINGAISGQHVNVDLVDGSTQFRVYRGVTTSGIGMFQTTGGAGRFRIQHGDTTNAGGNANIAIEQGNNAYFEVGKQAGGTITKNHFYGQGYGSITSYNTLIASSFSVSGSERGITFSNSNDTMQPAIIQGVHSGAARTLTLQYYGSNLGVGAIQPTAKLHIRGESDTVGNNFVAENLSNTANLTLANNGISTFTFPTGGKVLIAGAVGAGDTLLEIRRTTSNSGGFVFRSNNGLSQSFETTNGSFNIATIDNSNINLGMGGGVFTVSTNPSMSAINTGQRMMLGTLTSSILSRWLNIGYNSTLGQILQSVQNGSTPTADTLSLNPFGGNVTISTLIATGSLLGTSSYATQALSSSFASTASFVLSASFAPTNTTGSFTGSFTGSLLGTSSYATQALSSSYSATSSIATSASYAATASYVVNALTASYIVTAQTASYVLNAVSSSFASTASTATSSSYALTASFAPTNTTGSFTGSFTGSVLGTASYANQALSSSFASTASIANSSSYALSSSFALTASYVANASSFPFTGSAIITGSLIITGSVAVTQNITGSRLFLSSSNGTVSGSTLTVYGSGSAQPVFTVQGSQGELFSITDSLTGSLFSVNDISGLPILEVFSDNTTLIGNYQDPMLITTAKVVQTNSGSFTVYSLPTASYDTAFFEYSVRSGSNARAGNIMAIQSGSSVNFTETTTIDFGNTSAISFTVIVSGSNIALTGSSTTGSWTIKAIVKGI
jgi:hypothetical protein